MTKQKTKKTVSSKVSSKKKSKTLSAREEIAALLKSKDIAGQKALFAFDRGNTNEQVLLKFNLWGRHFFAKYYQSADAKFHQEIDLGNLQAYRGEIAQFVDIAYRGAAKTARTKLFLAYVIANDRDHNRRYLRLLSADIDNAKQSVVDIYNMFVHPDVLQMYPEIFKDTVAKREETRESFTTSTGVKVIAKQVGIDQRGSIMEAAKADFDWYDDFETKLTLHSARKTKKIWDNMEEARTGLALGGASIYTCNYVSEMGNVHTLVTKQGTSKKVIIIPIMDLKGNPTWSRYSKEEIARMKIDDDDFEGERMCRPSASRDVLFDRETLEKQVARMPSREVAGFKMFREFDPSHRYGSGHDVAGGVGLDSSTSVFIDFDIFPAQVVATFANNGIKPDTFGDEIARESDYFGGCVAGIEKNNHGHATIARAKQLGVNMYFTKQKDDVKIHNDSTPKEYGWHTNAMSKPKMLFAFAKAVEDGLVELNDSSLIAECMSYTRNDLIDDERDPRMTTRHFDLLVAACIAFQMKDYAEKPKKETLAPVYEDEEVLYASIGI